MSTWPSSMKTSCSRARARPRCGSGRSRSGRRGEPRDRGVDVESGISATVPWQNPARSTGSGRGPSASAASGCVATRAVLRSSGSGGSSGWSRAGRPHLLPPANRRQEVAYAAPHLVGRPAEGPPSGVRTRRSCSRPCPAGSRLGRRPRPVEADGLDPRACGPAVAPHAGEREVVARHGMPPRRAAEAAARPPVARPGAARREVRRTSARVQVLERVQLEALALDGPMPATSSATVQMRDPRRRPSHGHRRIRDAGPAGK